MFTLVLVLWTHTEYCTDHCSYVYPCFSPMNMLWFQLLTSGPMFTLVSVLWTHTEYCTDPCSYVSPYISPMNTLWVQLEETPVNLDDFDNMFSKIPIKKKTQQEKKPELKKQKQVSVNFSVVLLMEHFCGILYTLILIVKSMIQGIVYDRFKMGLGFVTDEQDIFPIASWLALPLPQKYADRFVIISWSIWLWFTNLLRWNR